MEFIRKTIRVGNSAGVILPKKLLGSEVKITVINRPVNIKKIIFKTLSDFLPDILGIYILNKKPIEILTITTNIKEIIEEGQVKISLVPLSLIKKDLKINQSLRQKLSEAEVILNKSLIVELKKEAGIKLTEKRKEE
jgi:hypothetical protein